MKELRRTALVTRAPAELFGLVNDVARYPEFVPGCSSAEVLSQDAHEIVARLGVRRGPLHTHFTTRNRLLPPHRVHMSLVEGPFRALEGHWEFRPVGPDACEIELLLRYEFSNALKARLFEPLLAATADHLVDAFVARARGLPHG